MGDPWEIGGIRGGVEPNIKQIIKKTKPKLTKPKLT